MGKLNWYPGHIKNAKSKIKHYLPVIDLVIEVVDSRVPLSSNIIFDNEDRFFSGKKRILLFSKVDLVAKEELEDWAQFYDRNSYYQDIVFFNKNKPQLFFKKIKNILRRIKQEKKKKYPYRKKVEVRAMVAGFPNVGKSTVLNTLAGRKKAKAANLPGVTRGVQWYRIEEDIYLMDTPGIIFPDRISKFRAYKLIFAGLIPFLKGVVDEEILLQEMIPYLLEKYPDLNERLSSLFYKIDFGKGDFLFRIAELTKKSVEWASRKVFYSFYREDRLKGIILDILDEKMESKEDD